MLYSVKHFIVLFSWTIFKIGFHWIFHLGFSGKVLPVKYAPSHLLLKKMTYIGSNLNVFANFWFSSSFLGFYGVFLSWCLPLSFVSPRCIWYSYSTFGKTYYFFTLLWVFILLYYGPLIILTMEVLTSCNILGCSML